MRPLLLRFFLVAIGVTVVAPALQAATSPVLVVEQTLVASPAEPRAMGVQLARSAQGQIAAIWYDLANPDRPAVRAAFLDGEALRWKQRVTVFSGEGVVTNPYNTATIALGGAGEAAALWYTASSGEPGASTIGWVSRTLDQGASWSAPERLAVHSHYQDFAALTVLPNGDVLAAWLDGRAKPVTGHGHGHKGHAETEADTGSQQLYARRLFTGDDELRVDPRVCDCCPVSLVTFDDGTALAAYRDRSDAEIRDHATARWRNGAWEKPVRLSHEEWEIRGCPVNGPSMARHGKHTIVAWFSGAKGQPAVYVSTSTNAGEPFLVAAPVDDGAPVGQVGTAMTRDGTGYVSWMERAPGSDQLYLQLRRLSPDGTRSVPVRLATLPASSRRSIPRLCLLDEVPGGGHRLLVAYVSDETGMPLVVTRLVTAQAPQPTGSPCATCPPAGARTPDARGAAAPRP